MRSIAKPVTHLLICAFISLGSSAALAKSAPGDGALPIVEFMPLVVKHEADLNLTPEQIKALADYRKEAMPGRIGIQKKILALRGELRLAMIEDRPAAEREELMRKIADAEIMHFKGRDRCVEFVRKTLSEQQFQKLARLYLDSLN